MRGAPKGEVSRVHQTTAARTSIRQAHDHSSRSSSPREIVSGPEDRWG
ncbi:MAG: hypothetical protein ACYSUF_01275 [Planctomycetota bacterium]